MKRTLRRFRLRPSGPALACCALALLVSALRPPAAAAVPPGVPVAWGGGNSGQLGNGTFNDSAFPVTVLNLSNVVALAGANGGHCLALRADGTVWAWGLNSEGQLGDGTLINRSTPVQVAGLTGVVAIGGGSGGTAIKSDGTLWAWGDNTYGQMGIGSFGGYQTTPVKVSNLTGVVAVAGTRGGKSNTALKADGTVWAWGQNNNGQLGDGTFTNRSRPVRVIGLPPVIAIATFRALTPDGKVWTWGPNGHGERGNGTFTPDPPYGIPTPAEVPNLSNVIAIADGNISTALKADGTVWTWGANSQGELGQGTFTPDPPYGISIPGQVVNLDSVVAIHRGPLAVKSDGSVWNWGPNTHGEVGNGTFTADPPYGIAVPVQVLGVGGNGFLAGPIAISGGVSNHVAVDIAAPYAWSGMLQPVNADGTSVFKKGSTVELKFKLTGASAGITDAQARFGYAQIDSASPGNVNETVSNAAGTSGILFQYDAASGEYRYNWRTTGLGVGRYLLRIDLGDGVMRTVVVGLK